MRYYCQCLNVTIDVLENPGKDFVSVDFIPSEEWFEGNLLSEQAIDVRWQCLLQSVTVREMKLNRCLACNQYTHVTSHQSNRILINKDLLNERTVKDRSSDPNYSKILKIVLPNGVNHSTMTTRSPAFHDETFQREYELAQKMYRQSMEEADRETEEKIRIYQQEQEKTLQRKTEAMNRELDSFLHFMHSMSHPTPGVKSSSTLPTAIPYISENSMESGLGSDIFDGNGAESSRQSSIIERTDTLDEDPTLDNTDWSNGNDIFARSLPKSIVFRSNPIPQQNDNENDDLARIGKSFRELSQSLMCNDGTELFGDLPSPRHNAQYT